MFHCKLKSRSRNQQDVQRQAEEARGGNGSGNEEAGTNGGSGEEEAKV